MPHGVTTREVSTAVFATRSSPSAVPFIVGTAPKGKANTIEKIETLANFSDTFGQRQSQDDTWDFSLARFAELFFQQYGSKPAYMVNVLDPSADTASVSAENQTFADGELTTDNAHLSNVTVEDSGQTTTYVEGTDYEIDTDRGVITRLEAGSISAGEQVAISYDYVDASVATAPDIVGGASGGDRTGLELIEEVFVKFGSAPSIILAPGFSHQSTVATAIEGKAGGFGGGFKAHGLVDVDSSDPNSDEVSEAISEKGSLTTSPDMSVYYPRVTLGDDTDWLSAHAAGVIARTDRTKGGGLPYVSPSNEDLAIDGTEVTVTFEEAQTLLNNGLVTVFRGNGYKLWNSRTAAYPGSTDVKDSFIPNSRMATHIENTLILSTFQKVDDPVNRRLISSVVSSINQTLNGWASQGALLGANVLFQEGDNPITELQDGKITFRILYAAPTPAEEIEHVLEVDVGLYENLFA